MTTEFRPLKRVRAIDTHTAGEPTRVVYEGGPNLGGGPIAERVALFRERHDEFRSAVVNEPRGSDLMVGALLLPPDDPEHATAAIYFNNVGALGMCGHGTIGVAVALHYLGAIGLGSHTFETVAGAVAVRLEDANRVSIDNVASYRAAKDVSIEVDGIGRVIGDVAWGGNWFFLVKNLVEDLSLSNLDRLTDLTWRIRKTLEARGIRGADGGVIDHIELYGPPSSHRADSKNFVLCPGKAYDRSPCGTGTSAKVACLLLDGLLREGQIWRQEGILGSIFEASAAVRGDRIHPTIRGSAYVNAETTLIFDPADPFVMGIRV